MTVQRPPIETKSILVRSGNQIVYAISQLPLIPIDSENPVEILIREQVKQRKMSLNDAMWAGPLADIAREAYHLGKRWTAEEWHEGFKSIFLPDPDGMDWDPRMVTHPEIYHKWSTNPCTGERICIGSTTHLTDLGMKTYLREMEAFATQELKVKLTTRVQPEGRPK